MHATAYGKIILKRLGLPFTKTTKQTFTKEIIEVYEIKVAELERFNPIVAQVEKQTQYSEILYNADVLPEQQFLYEYDIKPFEEVILENNTIRKGSDRPSDALTQAIIELETTSQNNYDEHATITQITYNNKIITGEERDILKTFIEDFEHDDPDIINMPYAFAKLAQLQARITANKLEIKFHRWHPKPITYKGGRSFYTYGQVKYGDFALRLHGRLLVDNRSTIGEECDIDALTELANLCGSPLQRITSRSFGAIFQHALTRLMYKEYLIPYKQKPVSRPMNLLQLLKADRAGLTLNSKPQFYTDVAEIDFSSMFPWIICNNNISAETMIDPEPPYIVVPNTHLRISLKTKGIVPQALLPILERRMHYKANPSKINTSRAFGLKQILVSSYGYLRFREFKLGLEDCHMAIGAFAREILIRSAELAEELGFKVVFGVVDSLYLQKDGITKDDAVAFCKRLEEEFNIPVSFEGIFKWIVFLPSVANEKKPVPTKYYGVFRDLSLKTRGIEVRKKDTCEFIYDAQVELLQFLAQFNSFSEIVSHLDLALAVFRQKCEQMKTLPRSAFVARITLTKTDYVNDIVQKRLLKQLELSGVSFHEGQYVQYLMTTKGAQLNEGSDALNYAYYGQKLRDAYFVVLQPFGVKKGHFPLDK
jgi:DNA polymerase elongation subunit (family B)